MNVRIIGSHGGTAPGYRTSCYMINDDFLIDCGSAASSLTLEEQGKIEHILITHPHIDHVKDICFLIENSFHKDRKPLVLRSTSVILEDIHKHLFNNVLWPDFSKIYVDTARTKTLLHFEPLEKEFNIHGIKIHHEKVNHPAHAVGFILDDGKSQIVFSGDTGPTDALWMAANQCPNLKAIFTEISFPTRLDSLAKASGHFTTAQLLNELNKIDNKEVPIYIAHFKPQFFDELMDEFYKRAKTSHAAKRIQLLRQDDNFVF
ncbi:MAG: MBL fold metallo-hydrolase [Bdellovibrionales bacterium]